MSDSEPPDLYEGILKYSSNRCSMMARKVIFRLQRERATGAFGGDYSYKTLWDEYCHDCQNGPFFDDFDDAMNDTVRRYVGAVLDKCDPAELRLLSLANPDAEDIDFIDRDFLITEVMETLSGIAGSRNLERFEVW